MSKVKLRKQGLRPGDPEWEKLGICDYITKPRIQAAITGRTLDGEPIKGDYKFVDDFPMSDGFEEKRCIFHAYLRVEVARRSGPCIRCDCADALASCRCDRFAYRHD